MHEPSAEHYLLQLMWQILRFSNEFQVTTYTAGTFQFFGLRRVVLLLSLYKNKLNGCSGAHTTQTARVGVEIGFLALPKKPMQDFRPEFLACMT